MLRPIINWLKTIPIADPIRREQAMLLQGLVLAIIAGRLFLSVVELLAPSIVPAGLGGVYAIVLLVPLLGILALLRSGRLRPAALLIIGLTGIAVTRALAINGLPRYDIVAMGYIIAIAVARLVFSRPVLVSVTAICIVAINVVAVTTLPGLPENARSAISFTLYAVIIAVLLDSYRVIWERSLAATGVGEERLRLALDAGGMGTWDWNLRSGEIVWAGHHAGIMGLDESAFDGRFETFARAVHPDDLPRITAALERARIERSLYSAEYRVVWPDGSIHWAAGQGRYFGPASAPNRMLGVISDVTARKAAEAALRSAQAERDALLARLQLVLERAPVGIVISAPDFTITYWNPAAERIFGWSAAEMLGRLPDDTIMVDEVLPLLSAIREAIRTSQKPVHGESANRRRDGALIICEWQHTPLLDHGGAFIGFLSMVQDVTERSRREEAIAGLNAELEQRVAARTAELAAKNRELEVFAYSVSHDLKAPLRGIDGYSRLLEEDFGGRLDGDGPYYIAMIRTATASMGQLIDDLLAYSRVERRAMQLKGIELRRLVEQVAVEYADQLTHTGAVFVNDVPAITVLGEEEGLAQVVRNLLGNAIKFSAAVPEPAIAIGAEARGANGVLWVRDNGIGFDMGYHERIFELFQRLHRAEDYPGTGIGLAIVRKALERMGGSVWAESAPGQGAAFFVQLPLAQKEHP